MKLLVGVLALLPLLGAAATQAEREVPEMNDARIRVVFDSAVRLYESGDFAGAGDAFLAVTRTRPRSADAWANLGAAAWESGDTAAAVVSWQRALRLDPTASDVRFNIERYSPSESSGATWIPPLPTPAFLTAAVAAWIAAWFLIFRRVRSGRRWLGGLELICLALTLAFGSLAALVHRQLTDRDAAVVTSSVMSRSLPSLESRAMARLNPGEVVVITDRQREWVNVSVGGKQVGWVHGSDLLRIAID